MTIRIENDFIGYLDTETLISYTHAVDTLHNLIKGDMAWMLTEYGKSKFTIFTRDNNDKEVKLYTISVSKINKLIKLGIL